MFMQGSHHHKTSCLQVFYNLGDLDDALTYALGAGRLFDVNESSDYVQTILGAEPGGGGEGTGGGACVELVRVCWGLGRRGDWMDGWCVWGEREGPAGGAHQHYWAPSHRMHVLPCSSVH